MGTSTLKHTKDELYSLELLKIANESMVFFQRAIEKAGYEFTGELKNEFEVYMVQNSVNIAVGINFMHYGRYKDMKFLEHTFLPPIEVMKEFVEKTGVRNFAWIPGYEKTDKVPAETLAVKNLAWAIRLSYLHGKKTRHHGGTWYNQTKMSMINVARRKIMEVTAKYVLDLMKDGIEGK